MDPLPMGSSSSGPRPFNDWMRTRLEARRLSQRELARRSGVSHATISRLIRGERDPTLSTASKVGAVLAEWSDPAVPGTLVIPPVAGSTSIAAGIESVLRTDRSLTELDVQTVLRFYLAVRRKAREATGRSRPLIQLVSRVPR